MVTVAQLTMAVIMIDTELNAESAVQTAARCISWADELSFAGVTDLGNWQRGGQRNVPGKDQFSSCWEGVVEVGVGCSPLWEVGVEQHLNQERCKNYARHP